MSQLPIIEWSPESCLYIDPTTHTIQSATTPTEALNALGNPKRIILALGRRQVFIKTIRLPDVSPEEAKGLLRFRLDELFPLPAHEIAYDVIFSEDRNVEGRLATVFAAKSETVRQTIALFGHGGAKVSQVVPASLGAIFAAPNETTLLVSSSSEGTAYDVVSQGALLYSRAASDAMSKADIDSEVARATASAEVAGIHVAVHAPLVEIAGGNVATLGHHPLTSLSQHPSTLNLRLPEDLAKELSNAVQSRRRLASLLLFACIAVGMLSYFDRDDANTRINAEKRVTQESLDRIKKRQAVVTTELSKHQNKSVMVGDGLNPRQSLADVLIVAANAAPDGLWLTGVTLERGKDLSVRGTAKSNALVAAMVDALSASSRLRDVELVFSNNNAIGEVPVVQFSIKAHVVGNYPLHEPKKERNRR